MRLHQVYFILLVLATSAAPVYTAMAASAAPAQPVGVYEVSPGARNALLAMHAAVRHGRSHGALVAELSPEQAEALSGQGFQVVRIYANTADEDQALREQPAFDQFHTYDQIRSDFMAYAAAHPAIAKYVVLGSSVQGRELFGLDITNQPDQVADKTQVVFWGGIHGNEYGGGEVPYRYALYLCDNYGTDPNVTAYVNNNRIWCIPMINPDGRVNGTRENAHGIDLNRDLGYEWAGEGGSPSPFSQPETRAVREFCMANNVTLSTTCHCSGDDVFYPWGYAPQSVPDHAVTLSLSQVYAGAASYFCGNSWADYETHGEVLDYVYGSHGGICVTIEVSNIASQIPQTISRNQAAMNLFCGLANEGMHGTVTDASTGQPLSAAIWMAGNPIPSYSDPQLGVSHREVPPGTYALSVWAPGYLPQTVSNVVVATGAPGVFHASMQPGGGGYAYRVVSVDQRDPNHAHANVTFPASALGAPDGVACSLGSSGFIVLDMGVGHEILDGPGADFQVVEAITPSDPFPEAYSVYAGDAYTQNTLIGTGLGTTSFDLASSGLTSVRYLKILDASGAPPNGAFAGMDLDAVIGNINGASAVSPSASRESGGLRLVAEPNPFQSGTSVRFSVSGTEPVVLTVFDAAGRKVGSPQVYGHRVPGRQAVSVDGSRWSPGVYFCRIDAAGMSGTQRIVRVR